jgi:hypothetical protein
MTNKKSLCFKSQNVPTGVSDCHNIISTVIKGEVLHELWFMVFCFVKKYSDFGGGKKK